MRDSGGVRFAFMSLIREFGDTVNSRTRTSTQNTVKFLDRPLRSRVALMSCHMTRYAFAQTHIVTVADQHAERHLLSGWHHAPLDKRSKSPVFRTGNHGFESRRVYFENLAQLGEHWSYKPAVVGSSPTILIFTGSSSAW